MISSFTLVHDAILGGYPIAEAIAAVRPFVDEVVAVDMSSTDDTRALLERCADVVLDSPWDCNEKPMNVAFRLHTKCKGDTIIMHEADEVYDWTLVSTIAHLVKDAPLDLRVWRLQVAQNGQYLQWAPHPVHRVFPKGGGTYLDNPVLGGEDIPVIPPDQGYLWDLTCWFRDCYQARRKAHGECFGPQRNVLAREHFLLPAEVNDKTLWELLASPHWEAKASPFNLPKIVIPLVGMTRYEPTV